MQEFKKMFSGIVSSLKNNQLPLEEINNRVKGDVKLKGSPLLILICSSLIGCIGLSINSAAVVIGAKLISPMMVMIIGMGFGLATQNRNFSKKAFIYLLVQFFVIIISSTVFFLITPTSMPTEELITKTYVSISDILLAILGGFAAVIAYTRFEKYNVLPGVAIATSLVPPVCTIGYGIANLNTDFIFGAFYLFAVNVIFLMLSFFVFFRQFSVKRKVNKKAKQRIGIFQFLFICLTMLIAIPITVSSINDIRINYENHIDENNVYQLINNEFVYDNTHIFDAQLDTKTKILSLFVLGEKIYVSNNTLEESLEKYDLADYTIKIVQDDASISKQLADKLFSVSVQ